MKKVILIPDSFKGTMQSARICRIMRARILAHYPQAQIISIPVADGGEGSVEAFLTAVGGQRIYCRVKGPFMSDMDSFYGILPDNTAVIEMAACAGLPIVENNKNPCLTTTYGVGQLMQDAISRGCKRLIVGLGGSATNDLGAGAAAAMGVKFYDQSGDVFVPTGGTLGAVAGLDIKAARESLQGIEIVAMCDIDNPLCGKNGAAHVFGPQKGADEETVLLLDANLKHAAGVIQRELHVDIEQMPGAGAAGGMGGGMTALLGARLQMGIEAVLDTVGFDDTLIGADLVLTGEGRVDQQTLSGKVVVGVARRARPRHIPVVVIAGDIGSGIDAIYDEGVSAIFSINRVAIPFEEARRRSEQDLALTVDNLMRFYAAYGL